MRIPRLCLDGGHSSNWWWIAAECGCSTCSLPAVPPEEIIMTAVGGGNNIIAELPTTVSGTVECVRRLGHTGRPAYYQMRFLPVQDMERYVSPRPKYVEMGLQLRVDALPFDAGQLPLSRIFCPPNLVSGDPLWPRPPITCKSTAARIPSGRG